MSERRAEHVAVDLSGIHDTDSLHQRLQQAFSFPDFYGRNWDAFWDSIVGLVTMPKKVTFNGWNEFEQAMPRDAKVLREIMSDFAAEWPDICPEVQYR